ncbi:MAG: response regulator [Butyrivibrio sp.]|nr:response regulator [Butyrivibrio sp.]
MSETKWKLLLTGKNQRVTAGIYEHISADKGYDIVRCPADRTSLLQAIPRERPRVMILSLGDETRASIRTYEAIRECGYDGELEVIVAGDKEDYALYTSSISGYRSYFLQKPVSLLALYQLLLEIEETSDPVEGMSLYDFLEAEEAEPERKRILVVDDDAQQLAQIKEHLSEFYDVTVVRSGAAALRYLEHHEIDLMFLDYVMAGMDGPALLRTIRTTRALIQLPVVFLTGISDRDKVLKTLELKPQGYLVKPARKSELVAKIIEVLG